MNFSSSWSFTKGAKPVSESFNSPNQTISRGKGRHSSGYTEDSICYLRPLLPGDRRADTCRHFERGLISRFLVLRFQIRSREKEEKKTSKHDEAASTLGFWHLTWREKPSVVKLLFQSGFVCSSFYNKYSQRGSHFSLVTKVWVLNLTLIRAISHHAKPTEENHFLHGWDVKLCVCPRSCDSPGNTFVDQSHLSLQNWGSARQRLRAGAGQVHGRDAVRAFPWRGHETVWPGKEALPVLV